MFFYEGESVSVGLSSFIDICHSSHQWTEDDFCVIGKEVYLEENKSYFPTSEFNLGTRKFLVFSIRISSRYMIDLSFHNQNLF